MSGYQSEWWSQPTIAWQDPEPQLFLDVFSDAYDEMRCLVNVANRCGLPTKKLRIYEMRAEDSAKDVVDIAAKKGLLGHLISVCLGDQDIAASHKRILDLTEGKLRPYVAVARIVTRDLSKVDEQDAVLIASLGSEIASVDSDSAVSGCQGIIEKGRGFGDPLSHIVALIKLFRCTALVQSESGKGTGFLVGNRHLLTCGHVVGVTEQNSRFGAKVDVTFDFFAGGTRAIGERGTKLSGRIVHSSPPTTEEVCGYSDLDWESELTHLDFALIELDREIGAEPLGPGFGVEIQDKACSRRGFLSISTNPVDVNSLDMLVVSQHPVGLPLCFCEATYGFQLNTNSTRLRYCTNTLEGSSGAPVIDIHGRLVAMHHYFASKRPVCQGIPISAIAVALQDKFSDLVRSPKNSDASAHDPIELGVATSESDGKYEVPISNQSAEEHDGAAFLIKTVDEVERLLNEHERVCAVLRGFLPDVVLEEDECLRLSDRIRGSMFQLHVLLKSLRDGLLQRGLPIEFEDDEFDVFDHVIGGLVVLGISRAWIEQTREMRSEFGFPLVNIDLEASELTAFDFRSDSKANLLAIATKVLIDSATRISDVFREASSDGDSSRVCLDIPERGKGTAQRDQEAMLKTFFVTAVLRPNEYDSARLKDSTRSDYLDYLDSKFSRVRELMEYAHHEDGEPYVGIGKGYRKIGGILGSLQIPDLFVICPASGPDCAMFDFPVFVMSYLHQIHTFIVKQRSK
ncbi:serine protease [Stieleria sp. JC731]|uniref:trypsin-like serine peptidase n=1 Tax=Pirellulaceae TaxID=2691357 RepID=UPI001E31C7E7|nr:serine protease [Stieleria sp. JC731]MCC9601918.1 serine protease [Stieleria sp. JC731]